MLQGCARQSQLRSEAISFLCRGSHAQPLSFLGVDTSQLETELQDYLNSVQTNYGNWTSNWGGGTSSGTLTPSGYTWNVSTPYYSGSGTVPGELSSPPSRSQLRAMSPQLFGIGGRQRNPIIEACHAWPKTALHSGAKRHKGRIQ